MTGSPRSKAVRPDEARLYWEKANRYARAARANAAAGHHDPAVSNAVHAVINLTDAVCIQGGGKRSASSDHGDAVKLLHSLEDMDPALRDQLKKRLTAVLALKHVAEYEGTLLSGKQAADVVRDMERAFAAVHAFATEHGWS